MRSPRALDVVRASVVVAVAVLLGACSSSDPTARSSADPQLSTTATPGPRVSTTATPGPKASTTATSALPTSPNDAPSPSSGDGASFGVDLISWPDSMESAQALLAAMPEELGGDAREFMPAGPDATGDGLAGVFYGGERLALLVADSTFAGEPGQAPGAVGAQGTLASLFGLVYACDMDTYEGTIEPMADYPGPGFSEVAAGTPAWFSCRIDGAEGEEDFSAQAVGWTSTDRIAWLAVGPDDAAVQALVTAMQEAAG